MPEVKEALVRMDMDTSRVGGVFSKTWEYVAGSDDRILLLPTWPINDIAVHVTGGAKVFASAVPANKILEEGTDLWVEWNGSALFSNSVTAIKLISNGSTGTAVITVKTVQG